MATCAWRSSAAALAGSTLLALLLVGTAHATAVLAQATPPATPGTPPAVAGPEALRPPIARAAPGLATSVAQSTSGTTGWSQLKPAQQEALRPLAGSWSTLSEAQRRKWLALSGNYQKLAPEERAKMHSRMTDWVALSPQQRTQARLNFGETKSLPADDKKAKWEAYQALSPEEKRKLAADAQARPPATAAAVRPVPPQKLATVPKGSREAKPPRIAAAPQPAGSAGVPNPAALPVQSN